MTVFLIGLGIGFVLGGVGGVLIAALLFGSSKQGRAEEQARQATADAVSSEKTVKEVLHETVSDDPAADIRQRMRDRAGKP